MIIKYVQISLFSSLPRTAIAFTQGQHFVKSQSRYQDSIFVEGAERFFNVFDEISPISRDVEIPQLFRALLGRL